MRKFVNEKTCLSTSIDDIAQEILFLFILKPLTMSHFLQKTNFTYVLAFIFHHLILINFIIRKNGAGGGKHYSVAICVVQCRVLSHFERRQGKGQTFLELFPLKLLILLFWFCKWLKLKCSYLSKTIFFLRITWKYYEFQQNCCLGFSFLCNSLVLLFL